MPIVATACNPDDDFPDPKLFIDIHLEQRAEAIGGRPLFPLETPFECRLPVLQYYYDQVLVGEQRADPDTFREKTYQPSDLIGHHFGHWTVIGLAAREGRVLAKCVCGRERALLAYNLRGGRTDSCGCQKPKNPKLLTPAQEAEILASDENNLVLAERYNVSRETIGRTRRKSLQGRIDAICRTRRAVAKANEVKKARSRALSSRLRTTGIDARERVSQAVVQANAERLHGCHSTISVGASCVSQVADRPASECESTRA